MAEENLWDRWARLKKESDALTTEEIVRKRLHNIDPSQDVARVSTPEEVSAEATIRRRLGLEKHEEI
jgi:hypothetical protein